MSVLIKGMEMPDSCYHCKIAESCRHYIANYTDRRHPDCPLIELEQIVRCKDCKYFHDSDGCFFSTAEVGEDGFCSNAERRTDEAD